jgi:membrane fusion protein (multidrug efflux system)
MIFQKLVRRHGIVAFLAVIVIHVGGCGEGKGRASDRASVGKAGKVPVDAVVIRPRLLEDKIYATGTLLANEEVALRPEISGRVTGVFFQEGGKVTNGQLLLKINDSELQAQLKRKELEEQLATFEEQRKKGLFEIKGISQEEYDKALIALKMVQAEKDVIQSQLAKTEIYAPFDGVVGLRHVSEGSYVSTNMLVATMQDIDPMKVEFSIPEKYAKQIRQGTEVMVKVGDSPEERRGKVYAKESKIELGTRTMQVRATIANPHEDLIPGSFAKVEITLEQIPDAIVIPAEAVIPEISGEKVFMYADGKVRAVKVKTGMRTEDDVQILEGIHPQDTLVVTGLLQLADGREVEIKELR